MTKTCVPITGPNIDSARRMADLAISSGADLVEVRADLIRGCEAKDIESRFNDILGRTIITLRSRTEGGVSDLNQPKRDDWLRRALDTKALFVDMELVTDARLISNNPQKRGRIIASRHFLSGWNEDSVKASLAEGCRKGAIGKVAVRISDPVEGARLMALGKRADFKNFTLMGMGPGGEITRALAGRAGCEIVYCALDGTAAVAPGQLILSQQRRVARTDAVVVGLIGHPLGHSLSPAMQNAAMEQTQTNGIYLAFDVPEASRVREFMKDCASLGVRGFNVTIPYKEVAFSSMDSVDDEARRAKAVNTVLVQEDGSLKGFNTDIFGFAESLRVAGYDPRNKKALIVGAGGASRAAVIALWKMGAKIVIANRTPERAEELVKSMRVFVKTEALSALGQENKFSLIVNATPIGMSGFDKSMLVPESLVEKADAVMDMVYNPMETPLIASARRHGVKAVPGIDMLLYQGVKAFEIWTQKKAPVESMRKRLLEGIPK